MFHRCLGYQKMQLKSNLNKCIALGFISLSSLIIQGCISSIQKQDGAVTQTNHRAHCDKEFDDYVVKILKTGGKPLPIEIYCNDR